MSTGRKGGREGRERWKGGKRGREGGRRGRRGRRGKEGREGGEGEREEEREEGGGREGRKGGEGGGRRRRKGEKEGGGRREEKEERQLRETRSGRGSIINHKEVITFCSGSDCAGLRELEPCVEGGRKGESEWGRGKDERERVSGREGRKKRSEWERGAGSKRGRRKGVTEGRKRRIHTDSFLIVSFVGVVELIEVIPSLTLWNKLTERVCIYSFLFSI